MQRDGRGTVVWLTGEHDGDTSSIVTAALGRVVADEVGDVVVDLTEVSFLDASTLGALAHCRSLLAAQDRHLTLRGPQGGPLRVLEVCGFVPLVESAPADDHSDESGAAGALGSWVAVPSQPRAHDPSPVPQYRASVRS